jgi:hypothetical protein
LLKGANTKDKDKHYVLPDKTLLQNKNKKTKQNLNKPLELTNPSRQTKGKAVG